MDTQRFLKNRLQLIYCPGHIVRPISNTVANILCMQHLYAAYVRNCKFTSPTTLPFIQLMQRSFVEIARIDVSLTYRYMFVHIRQLAIHLRNAVTVKKKVKVFMVDICR